MADRKRHPRAHPAADSATSSLLVHPVVVGSGKRLFDGGSDHIPLKLVDSKTFSTGVLALTYARD